MMKALMILQITSKVICQNFIIKARLFLVYRLDFKMNCMYINT